VVLGEQVTVWTIGGFALVIAGSALVNRRQPAQQVLDESAPCPTPVTATT
jgi:drug/metabolite transporter (DMT)-like permease